MYSAVAAAFLRVHILQYSFWKVINQNSLVQRMFSFVEKIEIGIRLKSYGKSIM